MKCVPLLCPICLGGSESYEEATCFSPDHGISSVVFSCAIETIVIHKALQLKLDVHGLTHMIKAIVVLSYIPP